MLLKEEAQMERMCQLVVEVERPLAEQMPSSLAVRMVWTAVVGSQVLCSCLLAVHKLLG